MRVVFIVSWSLIRSVPTPPVAVYDWTNSLFSSDYTRAGRGFPSPGRAIPAHASSDLVVAAMSTLIVN